jgi:hypothetical protein
MPVRKIPKSFRAVTGRFPSMKNGRCIGYESKLERDHCLTFEFDNTITGYEEQPVKIDGTFNGRKVTYILDNLVKFNNGRQRLLIEFKYEKDLKESDEKLEAKLKSAQKYAEENNCQFETKSEKGIDSAVFNNYQLLYRFAKPSQKILHNKQLIIKRLQQAGPLSLKELLRSFSDKRIVQADYTPAIWHLLYTGEITTDLNVPISANSEMRITNGKNNVS